MGCTFLSGTLVVLLGVELIILFPGTFLSGWHRVTNIKVKVVTTQVGDSFNPKETSFIYYPVKMELGRVDLFVVVLRLHRLRKTTDFEKVTQTSLLVSDVDVKICRQLQKVFRPTVRYLSVICSSDSVTVDQGVKVIY